MTNISEIAKNAVDASSALQQSLSPALSGNAQFDAEQLVEQHRQLTATIAELLREIAKQHVGAATQVESQTLSKSSAEPDVSRITAEFDNWDKRILVGLAKLQEMEPARTGFDGNSINSRALGLEHGKGNCTHRMTAIAKLVPSLLTTHLVDNARRFFLLTDKGLQYAKSVESEIKN